MNIKAIYILIITLFFTACKEADKFDLVIYNSQLLDVKKGTLENGISIGIKDGVFKKISKERISGNTEKEVDAKGKLITPSFIDAHIHPISEFSNGNYDAVPDTIPADSINYYRKKLTDGYLPHGTTTVLMMGHPDSWTDEFLRWTSNQDHNHVDVYTCGGALATMDENTYKGHFRLNDSAEAKEKVIEYYNKGVRHLKLYWRLKEPELISVQETADSLGMKMYSHAGGFFDPSQLSVGQLLNKGIQQFEHIAILPCSVFDSNDWTEIHAQYQEHFGDVQGDGEDLSIIYILETFRHIEETGEEDLLQLINELQLQDATISTTIGFVYKIYHDTFFEKAKVHSLTKEQFERCEYNFSILMKYVKLIYEKGIPIRIGSDTAPGGQIVLLEMMLLDEFGIGIEEAFKIATINGAEALGIDELVGSIELDKNANFIIWDSSPIVDAGNLIKEKTIYKNGIKYTGKIQDVEH